MDMDMDIDVDKAAAAAAVAADLQSASTWRILAQSFSVLRSHATLLTSLALSFLLPLSFMLLAHTLVTEPLIHHITPRRHAAPAPAAASAADWAKLALFYLAYLLAVLAFSLLSTAAVVYTAAASAASRAVSYSSVLAVVPRVWRRLLLTFLWAFLLLAAYQASAVLCLRLLLHLLKAAPLALLLFFLLSTIAFFSAMLVHLTCVWHLASVVSVLEEKYGLGALRKSVYLIKGRRWVAYSLFCVYLLCTGAISAAFHHWVVHGRHTSVNRAMRLFYGIVLVLLLSFVSLVGMLAQTVFYFACKAYHREGIDWPALSEHLGSYLGEYVPLKGSIQMETLDP